MSNKEDLMEVEDTIKSEDLDNLDVFERYKLASTVANGKKKILKKRYSCNSLQRNSSRKRSLCFM
jgi:hypothetical protein